MKGRSQNTDFQLDYTMETTLYLKQMLRDKQVASFTPTSGVSVKKVCSKIDFSKTNVVVEYGPGTGVFTRYLLEHLTSDSTLILIERNEDFVRILHETLADPRLTIFHDSAENIQHILALCQQPHADYIISGIPFSFLPQQLRDTVVHESYNCLRPGGKFLAYQMFFQFDMFLKTYLDKYFGAVDTELCIVNVPPLRLFEAVK